MAQEEVVAFHRCTLGVDPGDVPSQGNAPGSQHPFHFELRLLGRQRVSDFVHQFGEEWRWLRERWQVLKGLRNLEHMYTQFSGRNGSVLF